MSSLSIKQRRRIITLGLAAAGAALGFLFGLWIGVVGPEVTVLRWAYAGALFLGIVLAGQGVAVFGLSLSRRLSADAFIGEEGRTAKPAQISFFRQQAAVLVLAGVMIALPAVIGLFTPTPPSAAVAAATMAVIAVCFAVQTALNLTVWRRADEFVRRLISETSALSFWMLQAALFLYAAGERLALLPTVTAWDCTVVLMVFYLCASTIINMRHTSNPDA